MQVDDKGDEAVETTAVIVTLEYDIPGTTLVST